GVLLTCVTSRGHVHVKHGPFRLRTCCQESLMLRPDVEPHRWSLRRTDPLVVCGVLRRTIGPESCGWRGHQPLLLGSRNSANAFGGWPSGRSLTRDTAPAPTFG